MFEAMFKTGIKASYSISDSEFFTSGGWKVHSGKHRNSSKKVSVFIFNKSNFETQIHRLQNQSRSIGNAKLIIEDTFRILRFEVSQLTKLKHPNILSIVEACEETKLKFIFVTEPLKTILNQSLIASEDKSFVIKGLYQVGRGLQFLHRNCSIVHHDLQPSSIFVTEEGDWKLGGFKFLQSTVGLSTSEMNDFFISNVASIVPFANLNLDFTAPELLIEEIHPKLSTSNDLWSIGVLIFWLYNGGEQLIDCLDKTSLSDFKVQFKDLQRKFRDSATGNLRYLLKEIPEPHWNDVVKLLTSNPQQRMNIDDFLSLKFFKGGFIKVMLALEEFSVMLLNEKLNFINDLLEDEFLLQNVPSSIITTKLIPILVTTILSELTVMKTKSDPESAHLISRALTLVLTLGKSLSKMSFHDRIYSPLFDSREKYFKESMFGRLTQTSIQTRLSIVLQFDTFAAKLSSDEVAGLMKNMTDPCLTPETVTSSHEVDQITLQNLFLEKICRVASNFEYSYLKTYLVPKLCDVFMTTTVLSTKVHTMHALETLAQSGTVDKDIIWDQILPIIENLKSRHKETIDAVISFFETLVFKSTIRLNTDESIDKVLCQSLRLVFGCSDCDQSEFKTFLKRTEALQSQIASAKIEKLTISKNVSVSTNIRNSDERKRHPSRNNLENGVHNRLNLGSQDSLRPNKDMRVLQSSLELPTSNSKEVKPSSEWNLTQPPQASNTNFEQVSINHRNFVAQANTGIKPPPGFTSHTILTPNKGR